MKVNRVIVAALIASFVAAGCGRKVDANKSLDEVRVEAQDMSAGDLEETARAYAKEITKKKEDLGKVTAEIKQMSPQELLSDKAGELKTRSSELTGAVSELTKRYDIYARQFREKGGDLSKVKIRS